MNTYWTEAALLDYPNIILCSNLEYEIWSSGCWGRFISSQSSVLSLWIKLSCFSLHILSISDYMSSKSLCMNYEIIWSSTTKTHMQTFLLTGMIKVFDIKWLFVLYASKTLWKSVELWYTVMLSKNHFDNKIKMILAFRVLRGIVIVLVFCLSITS